MPGMDHTVPHAAAIIRKPSPSVHSTLLRRRRRARVTSQGTERAFVMPTVTLRPIGLEDAEQCYLWVTDPDVARYLGLVQGPVSVAHERAWISSVLADAAHQRHYLLLDEQERPLGACGLRAINQEAGVALLGLFIGHRADWGKGYGTAATQALLDCGFAELGLREIRLSCHDDNRRAIRCYERAGFLPSLHRLEKSTFGRHEVRLAITRWRWEELRREEGA